MVAPCHTAGVFCSKLSRPGVLLNGHAFPSLLNVLWIREQRPWASIYGFQLPYSLKRRQFFSLYDNYSTGHSKSIISIRGFPVRNSWKKHDPLALLFTKKSVGVQSFWIIFESSFLDSCRFLFMLGRNWHVRCMNNQPERARRSNFVAFTVRDWFC